MPNRLSSLGAFDAGVASYRQRERERLADQELRSGIERQNQIRQLAGAAYNAPSPNARQGILKNAALVDPNAAMSMEKHFASREDEQRARLGVMSRRLTEIPRDRQQARAQLYQMMVPELRSLGLDAPDQYSPEIDEDAESLAAAFADRAAPAAPMRVRPGEALIDPQTREPIYTAPSAPPAPAKPMDPLGQLEADRRAGLISDEDYQARRRMLTTRSADTPRQPGPMPVGALKIMQDARDALSVAGGIDTALGRIRNQLASGELKLGPMANLISRGQNVAGMSSENSRRFEMMMSTLEKLRNDSLRLNKGVQTEGDAQRAWNELLANVNDERNVTAQLERIMEINARAAQLQQENMDAVRENYGRSEAPTSSAEPPAGSRGNDGWSIVEE